MKEIIKSAGEGVMDGLREAPREFVVPFILLWRGIKSGFHLIDSALAEARDSAHSTARRSRK
ncbi:hypothetical protein ACFFJT_06805 [Dyella flava]|uniref:Uncharacterized protein n=1 Tax=Dyella flava TaxID=1920170 RepID=A0ABS2JYS1_9GAMM|nr:hypothetical protein [Dyella flava]MBM7124155.1 hypothetical protein [Dyella flava]GLQ50056.1 hypothetical protein GCM10010872_15050 [Dyella flava]